jgi:hypothetical protein
MLLVHYVSNMQILCGPQGNTGSIQALVKLIKDKCCKKMADDKKTLQKSKCDLDVQVVWICT